MQCYLINLPNTQKKSDKNIDPEDSKLLHSKKEKKFLRDFQPYQGGSCEEVTLGNAFVERCASGTC